MAITRSTSLPRLFQRTAACSPDGLMRARKNSETMAMYMGAGVLLLCLIGAMMTDWRGMARAHGGSLFVAGLMIVFAASYGVFVADRLMLGVSPPNVREIVLQIVGGGDAITAIRQHLHRVDVFRIIAYGGLLVTACAVFLVLAWRRAHRPFVNFVLAAGALAAGVLAIAPARASSS
jgi:hypothetical protein